MARIRITAGKVSMEAELSDSPTAGSLLEALPITGSANRWGDEIYFSIPVDADQEADARADMAVGEIAYWPPGSAFCIFWGPTPASSGSEPRAASPVNVLGRIDGDATQFGAVSSGTRVKIEAV
jgi:hypothetical protein